jgi:hypothetical protein
VVLVGWILIVLASRPLLVGHRELFGARLMQTQRSILSSKANILQASKPGHIAASDPENWVAPTAMFMRLPEAR